MERLQVRQFPDLSRISISPLILICNYFRLHVKVRQDAHPFQQRAIRQQYLHSFREMAVSNGNVIHSEVDGGNGRGGVGVPGKEPDPPSCNVSPSPPSPETDTRCEMLTWNQWQKLFARGFCTFNFTTNVVYLKH